MLCAFYHKFLKRHESLHGIPETNKMLITSQINTDKSASEMMVVAWQPGHECYGDCVENRRIQDVFGVQRDRMDQKYGK